MINRGDKCHPRRHQTLLQERLLAFAEVAASFGFQHFELIDEMTRGFQFEHAFAGLGMRHLAKENEGEIGMLGNQIEEQHAVQICALLRYSGTAFWC